MTCEDCCFYNPEVDHKCDKYPAILPIDGVDICASFKPKEKPIDDPWESISK